jgi:LCP family protein required for cell wall assembly
VSQVLRVFRHAARLLMLVALTTIALPSSSVAPVTISLTETRSAKSVDFGDGIVWILVLGSDAGPGVDVSTGDTDAIQLLGMNFATGAATAIGFPRDFWIDLPGYEPGRINGFLKLEGGGPDLTAAAVTSLVGIEPDYVLVTGSDGFLSMVGAAKGVTVKSTTDFHADQSSLHVHVGYNDFDPQQALDYARTRYALVGGDRERSANHQALLLGLLRQLREHEDEEGFMEKVGVAAIEGLDTDLSPVDIYRLVQAVTELKPGSTTGCVLDGSDETVDGNEVIFPFEAQAKEIGLDAKEDAVLPADCHR